MRIFFPYQSCKDGQVKSVRPCRCITTKGQPPYWSLSQAHDVCFLSNHSHGMVYKQARKCSINDPDGIRKAKILAGVCFPIPYATWLTFVMFCEFT